MNILKKYLGLVWMIMAPVLILFMVWQAVEKISQATSSEKANTALQWVIILAVFLPICIGFFIFGKYSFQGEYAQLPESSKDLVDYDETPL